MHVYILFSITANVHYIGHSEDLYSRLAQHNNGFYSGSHTRIAKDWQLVYSLKCNSRSQAVAIEKHIKKMKSKFYIQNLIKYPEISNKLLQKYT